MATTRRRGTRLPAFLRVGRRGRVLGLVALVLVLAAGAVALVLAPGDHPSMADPLRSVRGWLNSPSATPSPSTSPSAASPSPSVAPPPSSSPKSPGPVRANCAPTPSACGLPDATNTGVPAGTGLTVVDNDVTVSKAGTVIDRKDIRGCVRVEAPGVTIRRSKITCGDNYAVASFVDGYSGKGLVIEDSEISCGGPGTGLGDTNFTARRVDIHDCENGFDIDGSVTVQDSYIHDLFQSAEAHTDGIQLAGGAQIVIRHNTFFANNGTSAIISHPTRNSDVLVADNLMAGGAYTLYCPRDTSQNYRVIGNRISTLFYPKGGAYGPWTDCANEAEVRGNVWDSNLKPLQ